MDTLVAKRNLANEKNTAQFNVDQSIQRISNKARETEFVLPWMTLYGEVNLSSLKSLNVKSVITKEPGQITEVRGVPDGVTNLRFDKQLLIEIPNLPKSIETINLDGNFIETADFAKYPALKVLRLNNNRLKHMTNLPNSLEELYVDNNHIARLNLDGLERLRVLHCRNNRTLRIENIPASMVDLQVQDGNPLIALDYAFIPGTSTSEDDRRVRGTEAEYVESLHKYFTLKTKYEDAAKSTRTIVREQAIRRGMSKQQAVKRALAARPKCVNCRRPVGTVFKIREDRFIAYCGDANEPCGLRIEIYKGRFESDDELAKYTEAQLLETKEKIIRQKMDVLFNYSPEEETVPKFKELIEEYNLYSFLHKGDIETRDDKRFNSHKKELMKSKVQLLSELKGKMNAYVDEYAESKNREALRAAMDIYVGEYAPEIHNLRMLKYNVMEMVIPSSESPDTRARTLYQSAASLRQLETLQGEVPRVLKFSVGNSEDA
jgi:hypothetical protein